MNYQENQYIFFGCDGETTWTNTGATRYGRGQHKTGSFGDDMLRPSPNHGTQRLPNDDDDDNVIAIMKWVHMASLNRCLIGKCCFKSFIIVVEVP